MSDIALGWRDASRPRYARDERRRHPRLRIFLPMLVQGHTASGATWAESTRCEDTSMAGCAFLLGTTVLTGQVLSIRMPLPRGLRRYDLAKSTYETYAIVKSARLSAGPIRVGVSFVGRVPPPGYVDSPGARPATSRSD